VSSTEAKSMSDPTMPFFPTIMGPFGASAEISAASSVRLLTEASARDANAAC
jgi:hypothetical protein